jgi:hypothetical protein
MRITGTFKLLALSLSLLVVASACGGIDTSTDRITGYFVESRSERLAERVDETVARLSGAGSDLSVYASETVTLSQLQAAGIPVGSHEIGCDDPLDMVVVEGMFDRENLFTTGVALAGGSFESLAMRMVAEIYDPETDMPLGMIGDETGGSLTGVTQTSDGSVATGSIDGSLMLTSTGSESGEEGKLVAEPVCQ